MSTPAITPLMAPPSFRDQCVYSANAYLQQYHSAIASMASAPSASEIVASASASSTISKEQIQLFAQMCMNQYHIVIAIIKYLDATASIPLFSNPMYTVENPEMYPVESDGHPIKVWCHNFDKLLPLFAHDAIPFSVKSLLMTLSQMIKPAGIPQIHQYDTSKRTGSETRITINILYEGQPISLVFINSNKTLIASSFALRCVRVFSVGRTIPSRVVFDALVEALQSQVASG